MKDKNIMLGVNTARQKCTALYSDMTYSEVERLYAEFPKAELSFIRSGTNWGGCDDISRTCEVLNIKPTGRKLKRGARYSGSDPDHGHKYDWTFEYNEIWETVPSAPPN